MTAHNPDKLTKRIASIAAGLGSFLTPFMGSAINIALPTIGQEFTVSAMTLGWIATAYLLTAAVFLVPLGKIADIYGRRKIFLTGIVIFTISSILCGISGSVNMLIAARILQGIGSPMIFGTGVAILTSVYPSGEKGKALGINTAAIYLGLSTGPFLGGFLTQQFGWRAVFFASALMGLSALVLVAWKLRGEWAEARGERFDWQGAFLYGLMLIAVMYGFSQLPKPTGIGLVLFGLALSTLFVRRELHTDFPLLNLDLFRRNPVFTFSNIAALISYSATFAVGFLLSFYLQYIKHLNPQQAGFVLVFQPFMQAIFSPLTGWLSDHREPRNVASSGMTLTMIGLILLIFLTSDTSLIYIVFSLILLGLGFALFSAPNTNAVMGSVTKRYYGVASGMLGTMRLTGQMLSLGISLMIFAIFLGNVQISVSNYPAFMTSIHIAFGIFAGLCCGGIFASLMRGKMR